MRFSAAGWMLGAHRRARQGSQAQPDEAAHRGTDPVDLRHTQPRYQGHHVGDIGRDLVTHRVDQPVGTAAADDIGTDHAPAGLDQVQRQRVEVAALA